MDESLLSQNVMMALGIRALAKHTSGNGVLLHSLHPCILGDVPDFLLDHPMSFGIKNIMWVEQLIFSFFRFQPSF